MRTQKYTLELGDCAKLLQVNLCKVKQTEFYQTGGERRGEVQEKGGLKMFGQVNNFLLKGLFKCK